MILRYFGSREASLLILFADWPNHESRHLGAGARSSPYGGSQHHQQPQPELAGEVLDKFSETVVEIITFLANKYEKYFFVDDESSARFNRFLFSLAQKVTKIVTVQFPEVIEKLSRIIIRQARDFIDVVESGPEHIAEKLLKTLKDQLQTDLAEFSTFFPSQSSFQSDLERLKRDVGAGLAGRAAKRLLLRAQALQAGNPSRRPRAEIGFEMLNLLRRAADTWMPFVMRDLNLGGEIVTSLGQVYLDLFQDLNAAKEAFEYARSLENWLSPDHRLPAWCAEASAGLSKIAQLRLDAILSELNTRLALGTADFIDYILNRHPPNHIPAFDPEKWKGPFEKVDKKLLIKLMSFYHPDKVDKSKVGEHYFKICEEISKLLGQKLQDAKDSPA